MTDGSSEADPASPPRRIRPKSLSIVQLAILPLVGFLLVAHTLKWQSVNVDTTSLALLGLILLTPLLGFVRRIKIGEIEAEIERGEVERVRAKVADDLPTEPEPAALSLEEEIRRLVQRDPQLAMAKVRIELEDAILRLHRIVVPGQAAERYQPLGRRVDELARREVLPPQVAAALRDVLSLANRAVHGERVERDVAEDLAMLGARLVAELRMLQSERLLAPIERQVIKSDQVGLHRRSRYRVTTIAPLVPNAELRTYVMDQDGLDAFLEKYDDHAEFIVRLEPIDT